MAKTWTYASDDFVLTLPADLPEEGEVRPVRYGTTPEVFWQALRIYRQYFPTIAAIFMIPICIGELLTLMIRHRVTMESVTSWVTLPFGSPNDASETAFVLVRLAELVVRWIATVVAFAPLVHAISDVCIGNRPRLRRSYQRVGWRTFVSVTGACALATLLIATPLLIAGLLTASVVQMDTTAQGTLSCFLTLGMLGVAGAALIISFRLFVTVLYVPIIVVVEPRVRLTQAIRRSRWLGRGYLKRTAAVVAIITGILLLAGAIYRLFSGHGAIEAVGIILARLLGPIPYIAATLIYYDLRARKEGYGVAERPEDLL